MPDTWRSAYHVEQRNVPEKILRVKREGRFCRMFEAP
jgi:hypothetical protein